jgi:flagellar hook-basal body complex protein FliE
MLTNIRTDAIKSSLLDREGLGNSLISKTNNQLDFYDILKDSFKQLNQYQLDADENIQNLVTGQVDDIHSVMIAIQKAQISLQFAVQIRNRVMDAYQEIMRMQV